jgi:hypothetical protein
MDYPSSVTTSPAGKVQASSPSVSNLDGQRAPSAKLSEALQICAPLPSAAFFIGLAEDGLPVLLNLNDPSVGPILIAADAGAGKTRLLQTICRTVDHGHEPDGVKYVVISENPAEWAGFERSPYSHAILSSEQAITIGYLASLVDWAESNDGRAGFLLLLVDGLQALVADRATEQVTRRLLSQGPSWGMWPIVTVNAAQTSGFESWLGLFRIQLYGHIEDARDVGTWIASREDLFRHLSPGFQFTAGQGQAWLPFWLPEID